MLKKDEVQAFKNELANYTIYSSMLRKHREKLDELYYELEGVKGIRYDKAPSMPNKHLIMERLHYLSGEIEKTENEIERLCICLEHMENVLANMEHEIRRAIVDVYINGKAIIDICNEYNYSATGLHYQMNKCIQKALEKTMGV